MSAIDSKTTYELYKKSTELQQKRSSSCYSTSSDFCMTAKPHHRGSHCSSGSTRHLLSRRERVVWLLNVVYDASERVHSKVVLHSTRAGVTVQLYHRSGSTKHHTLKYHSTQHGMNGVVAIDGKIYQKFLYKAQKASRHLQANATLNATVATSRRSTGKCDSCSRMSVSSESTSTSTMSFTCSCSSRSTSTSRSTSRSTSTSTSSWESTCSGMCPADCDQTNNTCSVAGGRHSTGRLSELIAIARRRGDKPESKKRHTRSESKDHTTSCSKYGKGTKTVSTAVPSSLYYADIHPNLVSDRAKRNIRSRLDMRRVSTSANSKRDLVRIRRP
jgi:hypothetical protein